MGMIASTSAPARRRASALGRALCAAIAGLLLAPAAASADMQVRTIIVGNLERDYLLYAPNLRPTSGPAMPLVVALHGGATVADMMRLYSRFNDIAARESFAVAYPYGIGRWWNDGRHADGRGESAADDVAFMRALVADVEMQIGRIDRRRVFATGISNGGFMSFRLACEAADLFAAIAPVAATMPAELGARCKAQRPVPVLLIHGTADALVPYVGGHARTGNTLRGAIWSADRTMAFWAGRNGCPGMPAMRVLPDRDPADGSRVIESEFRGCTGAPATLLRIEGGGHTWPGGLQILPTTMLGATNYDIDASETIWRFFKSTSRDRPHVALGSKARSSGLNEAENR